MLRASELWQMEKERHEGRMTAMAPVLHQIDARIRQQVIHNPRAPYIIHEIPTYVWGHPLFDLKEATKYLVDELTKSGYSVWVVDKGKFLFISWVKTAHGREPRPTLTTNYRPMAYDPAFTGTFAHNT